MDTVLDEIIHQRKYNRINILSLHNIKYFLDNINEITFN